MMYSLAEGLMAHLPVSIQAPWSSVDSFNTLPDGGRDYKYDFDENSTGSTNTPLFPKMASKHIVLHIINLWGHMKPLIGFTAHILEVRPETTFTILTSTVLYKNCLEEINRIGIPVERFRIVDFVDVLTDPLPTTPIPGFETAFRTLWDSKPLTCHSGKEWDALPAPTVAILDPFTYWAFPDVRRIAGNQCRIAAWFCGMVSTFHRLMVAGDMRPALRARLESGMDVLKASRAMSFNGEVVTTPGMPDMTVYDCEWLPQEDALPHAMLIQHFYPAFLTADTTILGAIREIEEGAAEATREAFGKIDRTTCPGTKMDVQSKSDHSVVNLLDKMQADHGPRSIFYVSFGTTFSDLDKHWAFFEELHGAGTPFLFADASPTATVPAERKAHRVSWAPQETVLSHPATQAFVTDGGGNSTQETLRLRVTPVCWPFGAEQPVNVSLVAAVNKAGFELLSVRSGPGAMGPPYRCRGGDAPEYTVEGVRKETRELLKRPGGPEGLAVRENAGKLADVMDQACGPRGAARADMLGFLEKYVG